MSHEQLGTIRIPDGITLATATWTPDHPKAIALLAHGHAEHLGRDRHVVDALTDVTGTYLRHDGTFKVEAATDYLQLTVSHIDEENGEIESEESFPLVAVGPRCFRVPDGPGRGSIVDFISYAGNGEQQEFLRMGGRLAERTAEKPSKATGKGKSGKRKPTKGGPA